MTHSPGTRARGDSPAQAAYSLRSIQREKSSYRRTLSTVYIGIAAAGILGGLAVSLAIFGDAELGIVALLLALAVAATLQYSVTMRGAALAALSLIAAAIAVLIEGAAWDLGWAIRLIAILLLAAATVIALTAKHPKFPKTPAVLIAQWMVPLGMSLAPAAGGESAVVLAAALSLGAAVAQRDPAKWMAARRASRRSGIPMRPGSKMSKILLGLEEPPSMGEENLAKGIEAEIATAEALANLGAEWSVFHSRALPGTNADCDHIAVGPPGVVMVDSKFRSGNLSYLRLGGAGTDSSSFAAELTGAAAGAGSGGHRWKLNGHIVSGDLGASSVFEGQCINRLLMMPEGGPGIPVVLAVYGATMDVDHAPMEVIDRGERTGTVEVVRAQDVVTYLQSLPSLGRSQQFVDDLAAVVDYLLPSK